MSRNLLLYLTDVYSKWLVYFTCIKKNSSFEIDRTTITIEYQRFDLNFIKEIQCGFYPERLHNVH